MISSLKGKISRVGNNCIEIEVNGMGYEVRSKVESGKWKVGDEITVFTRMVVSENDISLYGFSSIEDREIFDLLRTVSGVGPKTAMQIMTVDGEEIIKAIGDAEVEFFQKIKGIGRKTAQRIIIDLKSKIGGLGELNLNEKYSLFEDDLCLSLRQLGFEKKEIEGVVKKMPKEVISLEEKLSWCLQNLGGR